MDLSSVCVPVLDGPLHLLLQVLETCTFADACMTSMASSARFLADVHLVGSACGWKAQAGGLTVHPTTSGCFSACQVF